MLYIHQLNLLLDCVDGDVSPMKTVSEQKMLQWLQTNCGVRGVDWKFKIKFHAFKSCHGLEMKIQDPDIAVLFRLTFNDYLNENVDLLGK